LKDNSVFVPAVAVSANMKSQVKVSIMRTLVRILLRANEFRALSRLNDMDNALFLATNLGAKLKAGEVFDEKLGWG
jgi:hypothetical protein